MVIILSTCSNCKSHLFGLEEQSPRGSKFKVYFVQCTSCGVPVGTMDYLHTGSLVDGLEKKVSRLEGELANIQHSLRIINHNVQLIAKK